MTVPLVLALLGISLDLLRRLYALITLLLDPQEAVKRLSEQAHQLLISFTIPTFRMYTFG